MNPHDVAAELRARAEEARAEAIAEPATSANESYAWGRSKALDEAAFLVESAARVDPDSGEDVCGDMRPAGSGPRYLCSLAADHAGDHRAIRDDGADFAVWAASAEPAPAEEARAIEAHICLDCGTIYDHPTVCGLNGADSPTVPVRDAIQSREPAPAVREEARVEVLKAALEWVADNYPAAITAMPTSLFRPLRESPVESSQEARRVCTCNAIDTPHGPAPDEKTPGCPVHSPAPAVREEARDDE